MCVIAYKAKDVRFPSESNVRAMWNHNPDGAGVMWRDAATGEIRFVKGFMKLKRLEKWIDDNRCWLDVSECALHFRITTHGGTSPGNCHPFVVAKGANPHTLEGCAPRVLMHNGVLPLKPRDAKVSDTAELALRLGACGSPRAAMDAAAELYSGNRIVLMDEDGTHFYGDAFQPSKDPDNAGLLYSNLHFEDFGRTGFFPCAGFRDYGGYDDVRGGLGGFCYGFHYDAVLGAFVDDATGKTVDLEDVDPDYLSAEDQEILEDLLLAEYDADETARYYGMTPSEYRDAKAEAESWGMSVGEYVACALRDPERAEATRACG